MDERPLAEKTDEEITGEIAQLRAQDLALRNARSRQGTLADTERGHEALLADARRIVEEGWKRQARALKETGRSGVATWDLPGHFHDAIAVLLDQAGVLGTIKGYQGLQDAIKGGSYGMDLQEYERQHQANLRGIGEREEALLARDIERRQEHLEAERQARLSRIKGG